MSTNSYALYNELGRHPLFIDRQIRIITYWFKLLNDLNSNCILKCIYSCMKARTENETNCFLWTTKVKYLLQKNGFAEVWHYPESINVKLFLPILKRRLIDNQLIELREGIRNSTSLSLFKELSVNFEPAPYLRILCNHNYRNILSKLRLSSHSLAIETGRHTGISRNDRKCTLCNLNEIEDEYHFIIICPFYSEIRKEYISKYYVNKPSMHKFIELLNCTNGKMLKHLAIYAIKAFKLKNSSVVNVDN